MRGTQGALIVASSLQIIVGFSGLWRHVVRFVLATLVFCYNNFTHSVKCGFSQQSNIWPLLGKINPAFKL